MAQAGTGTDTPTTDGPPGDVLAARVDDGSEAFDAAFGKPLTLAESLVADAGWSASNFSDAGANPPYLRIGGKLWVTLSEYEPCFSSVRRDRGLFRSKVSIAGHLLNYDAIMVDPLAFEDCYGPGEGTEATFPFGAWLTIHGVTFEGIELSGRRQGRVMLPLAPLAVASAVWLRPATPG